MTHVLRYAARTHVGLIRQNNQDSVFAGDRLLMVADGMGGHAAGDKASRLAVNAFIPLNDRQPGKDLLGPLDDATHDSNQAIADMVADDATLDGMGTTITALLFDGNRLGIAHVGDSRAYLWRDGMLSQITHDDTFVQSLIDEGRITEDEAAHHPQRSLLLRAVNGTDSEPTLQQRVLQVGDRYLICSDGLSGVVAPEAIADTLASFEVAPAADRLIDLALRGGGPDNVTVIVADVLETGVTAGAVLIEEIDPDADLDATGPILPVHETQRMPRIPLPEEHSDSDLASMATAPIQLQVPDDDQDLHDDEDEDDEEDDEHDLIQTAPERKWRRRSALTLALVVLLAILGTGSFFWIRSQYYVGEDSGRVVIFRGVDGSILGWKLASATEDSCRAALDCQPLKTGDLVPGARSQVIAGIPASGLDEARDVITRLTNELLPPCRVVSVDPPATVTPTAPTVPTVPTDPVLTTIVTTSQLPPPTGTTTGSTNPGTSGSTASTGTASNNTASNNTASTSASTLKRPANGTTFARNASGGRLMLALTTTEGSAPDTGTAADDTAAANTAGNPGETVLTYVTEVTPTPSDSPTFDSQTQATSTLTTPALIPGETCRQVG